MQIIVDNIPFDVLVNWYGKRGFYKLPPTVTMSAVEILSMRGQDVGYWLQEEDARGNPIRMWRDAHPSLKSPFEGPTNQSIILRDEMRFGSFPPVHFAT
jgi:hypothetical protein